MNSTIFTAKNNELAIFGKTIDDVRKKLIYFNDVIMQGGSFGKNANAKQLIPTEKLFKELSNNEAKKIVDTLNSIKDGTKAAFTSMDGYLSYLDREGKGYIKNYVKENQNQVYVTDDVIDASKQARAEQIAYNETIRQSTLAFKAASIAKRIFATVGNMAAMWALSKAISVVTNTIGELIHSKENLRQSASDLGSELSNNSSDIEGYKKKIEELKVIINDSSSSFDEVSQARADLMAIQDELIEKFGTEKGVIESITNAINGQTNALDELSKRSYFQAKNKFNEKTGGDKVADWLSFGNTSDDRIQSNMDKMVNSMRYSFYELETTGNEVLDNLIAKSYGLNIVEDMYGDGKHFQVYGTLDEIQDKLYGIQELSQGFDLTTGFENSFTTISNDVDDALAKFKNLYDQYVLYEKILTDNPDNQYDEQFDLINKAKEAYNEAVKSGNEENLKTSADEYAKTLQSAIDLATGNYDYDVADYFKAMYPELQQMFGEWQFSLNFKPNTDGLQDKVADALDSIDGVSDGVTSFSVEDIENFNPNVATQEQIDAYGELTNVAESYGLTVKQLIALLQTLELIQSESYQQLVDKFGQDNVDNLSLEDLEIAYTIENAGNMTFEQLQAEIQKAKEAISEPIQSLSIPDTITHLNTNLKPAFDSLHAAYQNIFTDDGALDRSSIDILSTCDSIKSKLDEMSELGLKVDYSSFENFVRVLNNTESTEQDVEKAMNSLATSIAHAALSGAEDFDTMRAALENMDVSNSAMVAFDEFTNNAELLDEAVKQAGLTIDDFAMSTDDGKRQVSDAAMAFLKEMVGAENCAQALALLQLKQFLLNQSTITTADDCQNILNLATAANIGIIKLQQLQTLMDMITRRDSAVASGDSRAVSELNRAIREYSANTVNSLKTDDLEVDFTTIGGGTSAAGSAGRSAGRSYRDALKEELGELDSIISGVTRSIDDQISSVNEQKSTALDALDAEKNALEETKDAAVEALEAERDARLEVIEAQKEQLEEQVSLIDRQIEQKQKEIDAINDAADARQREIDLQKAQYELERMQNQHTILQYSEAEGMHYVQDTSGIRDAKEQADEAKRQIEIAGIEKEIDLLENEKDLIHEQIDLLDEQTELINTFYDAEIEKVEKFYDDQIRAIETRRTATESHFESVIRNLEDSKAKYEELTSVVDKAELSAKLKQLGIDEEALLSGSEEEFRKLKDTYMGIVSQLNEGNDAVMTSMQSLSGFTDTASQTTAIASDVGTIADGLNRIPDSQTITNLSDAFDALAESINKVAAALGLSKEAEIGTLAQAILNLNNIPLDDASKGILAYFTNLKTAIDSVTSAINGGGGESSDNEGQGGSPGKGGETRGKDSKGGGGGSLADAITSMGETAAEVIGEADAEGDGTVIGEFGSLKTAVDNVTSAVGTGELEDGNNKGGDKTKAGGKSRSKDEDSGGLTGSIVNLGKTTEETLGEPGGDGIIGRFEQFKEPISEAAGHVQSISDGLDAIDGKEVECTITVNVNQTGGADMGGAVLGKMNLDSTSHSAKFGKSNANGTGKNKGLPKAERNALISEYGQTELTVFPNGNTVLTSEPTLMDLPKGTVIFNEDQTKQLMRSKVHIGDTAHTDNTTVNIQPPASGEIRIVPFQPGDLMYDYTQKWNAYFGNTGSQTAMLMPASMFERSKQLYNTANQITGNNIAGKNQSNVHVGDIHITCPGVTSKEVAKQVGVELNHMFSGLHLDAEQQSRMR